MLVKEIGSQSGFWRKERHRRHLTVRLLRAASRSRRGAGRIPRAASGGRALLQL